MRVAGQADARILAGEAQAVEDDAPVATGTACILGPGLHYRRILWPVAPLQAARVGRLPAGVAASLEIIARRTDHDGHGPRGHDRLVPRRARAGGEALGAAAQIAAAVGKRKHRRAGQQRQHEQRDQQFDQAESVGPRPSRPSRPFRREIAVPAHRGRAYARAMLQEQGK